jgi:hypothetical protein
MPEAWVAVRGCCDSRPQHHWQPRPPRVAPPCRPPARHRHGGAPTACWPATCPCCRWPCCAAPPTTGSWARQTRTHHPRPRGRPPRLPCWATYACWTCSRPSAASLRARRVRGAARASTPAGWRLLTRSGRASRQVRPNCCLLPTQPPPPTLHLMIRLLAPARSCRHGVLRCSRNDGTRHAGRRRRVRMADARCRPRFPAGCRRDQARGGGSQRGSVASWVEPAAAGAAAPTCSVAQLPIARFKRGGGNGGTPRPARHRQRPVPALVAAGSQLAASSG